MPKKHSLFRFFTDSPLLLLLLPLVAGIFVADGLFAALQGRAIVLIVSGLVLLIATWTATQAFKHLPTAVKLLGLGGSIALAGAALLVMDRNDEDVTWPEEAGNYRIMITDAPRPSARSIAFTGRILGGRYDGKDVKWRIITERADSLPPDTASLHPGDVLLCHGVVGQPRDDGNPSTFSYAEWLRRQGITGTGFSYAGAWQRSGIAAEEMPLAVRALRLRDEMTARYAAHFEGRDLSVITAMTLGDTSRLDPDTRHLYSQTGTSHILALSGLNLSLLFAIYQFVVLRVLRRHRPAYLAAALVGIAGLWAFTLLAGCPLSLVRAAIMFSVMQAASMLRRDTFTLQNLALSAFLILVFSPQSLFDVGFQLSVLSVAGILLLADHIPTPRFIVRIRPLRYCWDILSVSLCCQIATAPLVAYYFHSFPVYGLLANLVAVPAAFLLLILALLFFLLPFLQSAMAVAAGCLLRGLDHALSGIYALPFSNFEVYPTAGTTVLLYGVIVCGGLFLFRQKRSCLFATLAATLACVGLEKYADRPSRIPPQIIFYNLHGAAAVHFITSAEASYVWQPRPADLEYVRRSFWKPQGMTSPQAYADTLSTAELYAEGGITTFRGRRIAVLNATLPPQQPPQPLEVGYLLLDRGFKASLKETLLYFRPRQIILSAALTDHYRRKFTEEAAQLGLPLYDIRQEGALVVRV